MNRIYRSIWNDKTGTFVAASENTKSCGKRSSPGASTATMSARFALKGLAVSLMLAFGSNALRRPNGRRGVGGQREYRRRRRQHDHQPGQPERGDQLAELQHRTGGSGPVRAAQQQFDSAQPGARLDPSSILGSLSANGKVFLVNPNGILFGQGAQVNVGGLVASTLNISDSEFMAGKYNFSGASRPASSIRDRSTPTAAMWPCWEPTSATRA